MIPTRSIIWLSAAAAGLVVWLAIGPSQSMTPSVRNEPSVSRTADGASAAPQKDVTNSVDAAAERSLALTERVIARLRGIESSNPPPGRVRLPDGTLVAFSLLMRPGLSDAYMEAMRSSTVEEWLALAEGGDASAASALAELATSCSKRYSDPTAVQARIDDLQVSGSIPVDAETSERRFVSDQLRDALVDSIRKTRDACEEFRTLPSREREYYARLAAANGSVYDMQWLGKELRDRDPEQALSYLVEAWRQGDSDALPALAAFYRHLFDTGRDPKALIDAVAAQLAAAAVLEAIYATRYPGHVASRFAHVQEANAAAAAVLSQLQPYQQATAIERAAELVRSNPQCCY